MNTKFEAWKIRREIMKSGVTLDFKRQGTNEYGEPDDAVTDVISAKCLYHEQNAYIEVQSDGQNTFRSKKIPMLLVVYDEDSIKIQNGDIVNYSGHDYIVNGITNVQFWDVILDISLEVIQSGSDKGNQ